MAELKSQQQEAQINGGAQLSVATNAVAAETITTKRQRRPSVRLGDIGDQPAAAGRARQWKLPSKEAKSSKTRPMTNLGGGYYRHETLDGVERERDWKVKDSKPKRGLKRLRTNWALKIEEGGGNDGDGVEKISGAEDGEDVFVRDFEMVGSESPLKEQSPVHSVENLGVDGDDRGHGGDRELHFRRPHNSRGRIDDGRDHDGDDDDDDDHGVELDGPSDNSRGHSGRRWRGENGVRIWLNGLGLGRYWPVFEIHEVDDEVLPLLTLEDLKDMGINAVGSRRKMYCAIQKLSKGFS